MIAHPDPYERVSHGWAFPLGSFRAKGILEGLESRLAYGRSVYKRQLCINYGKSTPIYIR